MRRIPPVFGRLGLEYSRSHWGITVESLAAGTQQRLSSGDQSDNRIPAGGTPGWWVLNVFGSYSWKWMTVRAGAWNMFNQDYRYHGSGINGMGRSVSVSLSIRI
ncbi:MAG: TonB-dependent receptor [Saprospirales bacterium]|nr:TonB-dependent receptor [Saprospirales bacterium]